MGKKRTARAKTRRGRRNISAQLTLAEAQGLIRPAQLHPELEYLFRHNLVQAASYESLLRHDRRRLHHVIGEKLEATYPDRCEELAASLAYHFDQGARP